ncbi:hypothetical protein EYD79_00975 [Shigella sonnei]|nr:hypothetical protein [Escherichia coli]EFW5532209.1 hypothetical protein [Shigella sonnei]EFX7053217.1 hypothetical protein [Shigella sonnei]EFZ0655771.1 hypothetical protein [Shigella sonnei]EFZ2872814.1 hypothetical protein [Shigella sonnei]
MADKLIRVNDKTHVMASDVIAVKMDSHNRVIVETSTEHHYLDVGYGELGWNARDRFIQKVNDALAG